jgi:hypothetical protein
MVALFPSRTSWVSPQWKKLSRDRREDGSCGGILEENGGVTAPKRSNSAAVNRTIRELRKTRHIEAVDDAAAETCRYTAKALDQLPSNTSAASKASLVRAHLSALKLLRGDDSTDVDAGISEIIAALSVGPQYPSEDELAQNRRIERDRP